MDLMTKLALNGNLSLIRSAKDAVIRYDKICRTCLRTNNVVSVFDIVYESYKFVDLLEQHVSILVQENDALPTQICDNCIADVIYLHVFKKKCLQTQVTLDEIIKYNEAPNAGIVGESCNKIQVPLVCQEFLTPQGNCHINEKVHKADLNKNNNRPGNQNCKNKQNNSEINSDKTISVDDCTNFQTEIIMENNCNSLKFESITEKNDCNQNICFKEGNNNIAEAEHKIIKNGLNFQKDSANVSVKKLETVIKIDPSEQQKKCEIQKQEKVLARKLVRNVCKERFDTIDCIKQHRMDAKYYRERKMACYFCGKLVGHHWLVGHLRTHTLEKPYKCNTCHKAFSLKYNLQRHIKSHDRKICGKGYTRQNTLKRVHTGERPYACKECRKSFTTAGALKIHTFIHTGEKPYSCKICSKSFNQRITLTIHLRTHSGEKPYVCDCCGKSFATKGNLSVHIPTHTGETPHVCEICHKKYSSKARLYTHKIRHGEKRFQCTVCEKKFHIRVALNNHYRVHTGEKPYACKECGKSFATAGPLKIHTFIHTGEKPYSCKICSKSFNQRITLTNHLRTHSGEKPYACDFCGKSFAVKGNLSVHIRTHTGESPHVCEICDRGFRDPSSLKKHEKIHNH